MIIQSSFSRKSDDAQMLEACGDHSAQASTDRPAVIDHLTAGINDDSQVASKAADLYLRLYL